jgi:hypothetical protein
MKLMQRSWILGISVAAVIGSAGASFAAIGPQDLWMSASVSAQDSTTAAATAASTVAASTTSYRIGDAGNVSVDVVDGIITITAAEAGEGWTVVATSAPGSHVDAQFSDGVQTVTFAADLVNGQVVVSLSNSSLPNVGSSPSSSVPMQVTQIEAVPADGTHSVATPAVARPTTTHMTPTLPPTTHATTSRGTVPHTTVPHTTTTHPRPTTTTTPRTTVHEQPTTTVPHHRPTTTTEPQNPVTQPTEPQDD